MIRAMRLGAIAVTCVSLVNANAETPIPFGSWTASNGSIDASCPSGRCRAIVDAPGFMQRALLDDRGDVAYYQTIILDKTATGTVANLGFSSEQFVKRDPSWDPSSPGLGLAARQIIQGTSTNPAEAATGTYSVPSQILTGWASSPNVANIILGVSLTENGTKYSTSFIANHSFEAMQDTSGNRTGYRSSTSQQFVQAMGRDQDISNGDCEDDDNSNNCTSPNNRDVQGFTRRAIGGSMSTGGTATLPGPSSTSASRSISWAAGDEMIAMWNGQKMNHWEELEDEDGLPRGFEELQTGIQAYENRTTGTALRYFAFGTGATNPVGWQATAFGVAPMLPAVQTGVTGPRTSTRSTSPLATYVFQTTAAPVIPRQVVTSPAALDDWTAASGIITATCPSGFICGGNGMLGKGVLQRVITNVATGESFIQNIVIDSDATGAASTLPFSIETLVRFGSDNAQFSGILSQQRLASTAGGTGFADQTILRTGWADNTIDPNISIEQRLDTGIPQYRTQFSSEFRYKANVDAAGNRTGFSNDVKQIFVGTANLDPFKVSATRTDNQIYVRRQVAGDMLTSAGSASLSGEGERDGGTVRWAAGQNVKVTWIGHNFDPGSEDSARFGYQAYDNLNDTAPAITTATWEDGPGPWSWPTNTALFGPRPVFPWPVRNDD